MGEKYTFIQLDVIFRESLFRLHPTILRNRKCFYFVVSRQFFFVRFFLYVYFIEYLNIWCLGRFKHVCNFFELNSIFRVSPFFCEHVNIFFCWIIFFFLANVNVRICFYFPLKCNLSPRWVKNTYLFNWMLHLEEVYLDYIQVFTKLECSI